MAGDGWGWLGMAGEAGDRWGSLGIVTREAAQCVCETAGHCGNAGYTIDTRRPPRKAGELQYPAPAHTLRSRQQGRWRAAGVTLPVAEELDSSPRAVWV
eukprot:1841509-Prymnesium_polylepis.1